ncbi:Phosphoenolpyruvate-protein phosphotransferase [Pseudodesulfovibrio profundus]|uniref:Phosphoenolpyruvate-protein phosphotransferase n=1 Tax=Pseudodesulfovibrio profundus TaxID=57320 RepID=A0A2C8FBN8_9BACT|nr:phosphoenolpyruvate--protein phosphotransferase [Pseudodesulfovibrio profundus]MBC15924.1 phosphoenolpyruvate--protein phosphotransferase [Desulfovibrio sp.]SOB59462.1 Phosphoenolpyruvate-protein phosphotransferase [Pseudodesulfovibrio profundus]|tara:strand:- start:1364 stop:3148 length:1785 start_codon:yes stop_codon:yes gene_type:complete
MADKVLTGISVATGIAIGKAFFVNRNHRANLPRQTVAANLVPDEIERLHAAFSAVESELSAVREQVPSELKDYGLLIDTHIIMLKDPKLSGTAESFIKNLGLNAAWALEKAVSEQETAFRAIDDPYIRERMQDVRVVADKVLVKLIGQEVDLEALSGRAIIMAHDLSPADTVELQVDKIMGFATVCGGKTSHTGIMARSLAIPALVGVDKLEDHINDGDLVVVDGLAGKIVVNPNEAELEDYNERAAFFEDYTRKIKRQCQLPAETFDGSRVQVLANIELVEEVATVIDNGGEGVGLYRTEYAYLNRTELPSEEELAEKYIDLASIMSPKKVVFRTLDLGADKFITSYGELNETNPAMGLRAIRFCLKNPQLFKTQLRAILRASAYGNVSLMFPMISGVKEVRQAKAWLAQAKAELRREGVEYDPEMPIGIMIELPAAVMIAEYLAHEVDFFSIGTNDLIQYSIGVDRTNHHVSYLYQPLHPATLRTIKLVVDAAHQAGIEVSLCGEVASDPFCVPILLGMGIDSISLTPQAIPGIKRIIRQTNMHDCRKLLRNVLECRTVSRINNLVMDNIFKNFPDEVTFFTSLLENDEAPS